MNDSLKTMHTLLAQMRERGGSDLFITAGFPPAIKLDGKLTPLSAEPLAAAQASACVRAVMNDRQAADFDASREATFAISPDGLGRFRVSAFVQMGLAGMVLRTINTAIPRLDALGLPAILQDVVMSKRRSEEHT